MSKAKIEQITEDCSVVIDFDEILSVSELGNIIKDVFQIDKLENNLAYGVYEKINYCIFFLNVSYLGYPHPIHKKRIQIPARFKDIYEKNEINGIRTLLIGVYNYKGNILFCDFDISKYINNKINNSSAHIWSIDLVNGTRTGFFVKTDSKGNVITVFNKKNIINYLNYKLCCGVGPVNEVFETLDDFFLSMEKEWSGIEAYEEMFREDYHDKGQAEWAGAYLEYKLSKYIKDNNKESVLYFYQDKGNDGIDLDLKFPKIGCYGDLKAHSIGTYGIQGNDYETIMELLDSGIVYYVVANHETEKDKDHNYEVTNFWNKMLNKDDLFSYGNKMKFSVTVTNYQILELNRFNKSYLRIYNQGKNSNGKSREPKIIINKRDINNFLVHTIVFDEVINI